MSTPSSSPPVTPSSISSRMSILAMRVEVLDAGADVLLERLLGQVEHVRREERLAVLREVRLVGVEEAVEPRQPRALAVVGVQDDGHAVRRGDRTGVERALRGGTGREGVREVTRDPVPKVGCGKRARVVGPGLRPLA